MQGAELGIVGVRPLLSLFLVFWRVRHWGVLGLPRPMVRGLREALDLIIRAHGSAHPFGVRGPGTGLF